MIEGIAFQGFELVPPPVQRLLKQRFRKLARATGLDRMQTTVLFVNDSEMQRLNLMYRGLNKSTDVLSFAAWEGQPMPGLEHVLGDLVISIETASRQAEEQGHALADELSVLLIHGLLHLLGQDHERSAEEAVLQAECEMGFLSLVDVPVGLCLVGRSL